MNQKPDDNLPWIAVRRDRAYLPETMHGDREPVIAELEALLTARGVKFHIEGYTDQIDVFAGGRKIGVYMP